MFLHIQFDLLEARIATLEKNPPTTVAPDMIFFQNELNRLDPANRSISFIGFTSQSAAKRTEICTKFLQDNFLFGAMDFLMDYIYKGPASDRKLSSISLSVFTSKGVRDSIMKDIRSNNWGSYETDGIKLRIDYSNTKR